VGGRDVECPSALSALELMPRALALSTECRIGIYDCLYVALAERENCELITADDKLIRAVRTSASLLHLRDLPTPEAPSA
jgi:predicted nucleic acid-binding protein